MNDEQRSLELADEALERMLELVALQLAPESVASPEGERYLLKRRLALSLIELIDERIRAAAERSGGFFGRHSF